MLNAGWVNIYMIHNTAVTIKLLISTWPMPNYYRIINDIPVVQSRYKVVRYTN